MSSHIVSHSPPSSPFIHKIHASAAFTYIHFKTHWITYNLFELHRREERTVWRCRCWGKEAMRMPSYVRKQTYRIVVEQCNNHSTTKRFKRKTPSSHVHYDIYTLPVRGVCVYDRRTHFYYFCLLNFEYTKGKDSHIVVIVTADMRNCGLSSFVKSYEKAQRITKLSCHKS